MKKRSTFGSRFGAVAVVGGSAVGLGNIWRFPYVAGENGGAAFILIYIIITLLVSVPVMLSEFAVGRASRSNALGAFKRLAPHGGWQGIGYLGIASAFVILAFYSVVAGWSLDFLLVSLEGGFVGADTATVSEGFRSFIASGWKPIVWSVLFVGLNCAVIGAGVNKGIERYSKLLMPLMVVLLIGLSVNSATLSGFREGAAFLLRPDFSKIDGQAVIQALGQSFFSMSIGMGAMITYGSYLKEHENIYRVGAMVTAADVGIAVLAGLAIFPAVFTYGIEPASGPDLVFLTLPSLFGQMAGGYVISIVFFFLLFAAAITSSFSLLEVIVAYASEEFRLGRRAATAVSGAAVGAVTALCALSQMPGSGLRIAGMNLFDLFDRVSSNFMLPVGGFAIVVFAGWFMNKQLFRDQFTGGGRYGVRIYPFVRALVRFAIPIAIALMFLSLVGLI